MKILVNKIVMIMVLVISLMCMLQNSTYAAEKYKGAQARAVNLANNLPKW